MFLVDFSDNGDKNRKHKLYIALQLLIIDFNL